MMGNPHSGWGGPGGYTAVQAEARAATLALCNAAPADYECIFTSGATGEAEVALTAAVALIPLTDWEATHVFVKAVFCRNLDLFAVLLPINNECRSALEFT